MKKNKIYIISGLVLTASVVAFIFITKKDKVGPVDEEKAEEIRNSRDGVPLEQTNIPSNLKAIVDLPVAQAKKLLVGKIVYTKVADVNVRSQPRINNGFIDNIQAIIPKVGTQIGKVIDVVENEVPEAFKSTETKKPNGMKFKWVKIKPFSSNALKAMNANDKTATSWFGLPHKFDTTDTGYVHEETITI